jgi:hypothetical protein
MRVPLPLNFLVRVVRWVPFAFRSESLRCVIEECAQATVSRGMFGPMMTRLSRGHTGNQAQEGSTTQHDGPNSRIPTTHWVNTKVTKSQAVNNASGLQLRGIATYLRVR